MLHCMICWLSIRIYVGYIVVMLFTFVIHSSMLMMMWYFPSKRTCHFSRNRQQQKRKILFFSIGREVHQKLKLLYYVDECPCPLCMFHAVCGLTIFLLWSSGNDEHSFDFTDRKSDDDDIVQSNQETDQNDTLI